MNNYSILPQKFTANDFYALCLKDAMKIRKDSSEYFNAVKFVLEEVCKQMTIRKESQSIDLFNSVAFWLDAEANAFKLQRKDPRGYHTLVIYNKDRMWYSLGDAHNTESYREENLANNVSKESLCYKFVNE